jgi:hypothetical protein
MQLGKMRFHQSLRTDYQKFRPKAIFQSYHIDYQKFRPKPFFKAIILLAKNLGCKPFLQGYHIDCQECRSKTFGCAKPHDKENWNAPKRGVSVFRFVGFYV